MEGIIVLIITLGAFLAIGIYLAFITIRGPKLPDGHKFEYIWEGNKAIVIVDKGLRKADKDSEGRVVSWMINGEYYDGNELAKKCAVAIHAVELAFKEKGIEKADIKEVVFLFSTDDAFESGSRWWQSWAKGAAAYATQLVGNFRYKIYYMAVIRSKYIKRVFENGQPAIHELVHLLFEKSGDNYQHDHSDPRLWIGSGKKESVEWKSIQKWKEILDLPLDNE